MDCPKLSFSSNSVIDNSNSNSRSSNSEFELINTNSHIDSMSMVSLPHHSSVSVEENSIESTSNSNKKLVLPFHEHISQMIELNQSQAKNELLAKENELLKKHLEETKQSLAQTQEQNQRLENQLDSSRSVMAKMLRCQIGAKKKELAAEKSSIPPPKKHQRICRDIWTEPTSAVSGSLNEDIGSDAQATSNAISHDCNEQINASDWISLNKQLYGQNDIIVHLQTQAHSIIYEKILDCIVFLLSNSTHELTNGHEQGICIILVPETGDGRQNSYNLLQAKNVDSVYIHENGTQVNNFGSQNSPMFYVLTCDYLLHELNTGKINLDNIRFILFDSFSTLVTDSDFARCIQEIQTGIEHQNCRLLILSNQLDANLMPIVQSVLHPGYTLFEIGNEGSQENESHPQINSNSTLKEISNNLIPNAPPQTQQNGPIIDIEEASPTTSHIRWSELLPLPTMNCQSEEQQGTNYFHTNTSIARERNVAKTDIWREPVDAYFEDDGDDESEAEGNNNPDEEDLIQLDISLNEVEEANNNAEESNNLPVFMTNSPNTTNVGPDMALELFAISQRGNQQQENQQHPAQQQEENSTTHDAYESALESIWGTPTISRSSLSLTSTSDTSSNSNPTGISPAAARLQFDLRSIQRARTDENLSRRPLFEEQDANAIQSTSIDQIPSQHQLNIPAASDNNIGFLQYIHGMPMQSSSQFGREVENLNRRIEHLEGQLSNFNVVRDDLFVDLDIRLDQVEERLHTFNTTEDLAQNQNQLIEENSNLRQRMANVEQRMERIEQSRVIKNALLMQYANEIGQRNPSGELLVDNPFAYSDQFKELIFVAGCFGYRGIVVSRAAQFENFSVQLLDHIVQHALHSHSVNDMVQFLVLNFAHYDASWPISLLDEYEQTFTGRNSAVRNGNITIPGYYETPNRDVNGIKKSRIQFDKVIYTLRNVHSRTKFVLELYFNNASINMIYQRVKTFTMRRLD